MTHPVCPPAEAAARHYSHVGHLAASAALTRKGAQSDALVPLEQAGASIVAPPHLRAPHQAQTSERILMLTLAAL